MCFIKKVFLKTFPKFTGKHQCWSLFINKVALPYLSHRTPLVAATDSTIFAMVKGIDKNIGTKEIEPNSDFVKLKVHKLRSQLRFQTYGRFPTARSQC